MIRAIVLVIILSSLAGCASAPLELSGDDDYIVTIPLPAGATPVPSGAAKVYFSADRWDTPITVRRSVRTLMQDYDFRLLDTWPLELIEEYCIVIEASPAVVERMKEDRRITSIQKVNQFVTLASGRSQPPYNDDRLDVQLGRNVDYLNRLHEWATGRNVNVGVIDTPIDVAHPDLKNRIVSQEIFVAQPLEPIDYVHGTAVTGIIGAEAGNGIGVVGFAPDSAIRSFAACRYKREVQSTVCNTFSLAKAIAAAGAYNLDVLNMSLAGPEDFLLSRLINAVIDKGTIVVAPFNPDPEAREAFPASSSRVVGVRSSSDKRALASNSVRIDDEHLTTQSGGGYQFFYGASMSAARVTALISLLLEKQPALDEQEIIGALVHVSRNCVGRNSLDDRCVMKFALAPERLAISMREGDE